MKVKGKLFFSLQVIFAGMLIYLLYLLPVIFSQSVLWYLFYFLMSLIVLSLVMTVYSLCRLQLISSHHLSQHIGQKERLSFEIRQAQSLTSSQVSLILGDQELPLVAKGYGRIVNYQLDEQMAVRRGYYETSYLNVKITDWLGFFRVIKEFIITEPLMVLPQLAEKKAAAVKHELAQLENLASQRGLPSYELQNIRLYREGDSFQQIDWKLSAKGDELLVKEFINEVESQRKFLFLSLAGKNFEKLLGVFYTYVTTYENGQHSHFVTPQGELTHVTDKTSAQLTSSQELEQVFQGIWRQDYQEQDLILFIPLVNEAVDIRLRQLSQKNKVTLISFDQGQQLMIKEIKADFFEKGGYDG